MDVERLALKERLRYLKYYNEIDKYIVENNMAIGGMMGAKKLLDEPLTHDDYEYVLYSKNAYKDAMTLANQFYDGEFVVFVKSVMKNEHILYVDSRPIATIYQAETTTNNFILDPYLWLLEAYDTLFDISKMAEWDTWIRFEKSFWTLFNAPKIKLFEKRRFESERKAVLKYLKGCEYAILSNGYTFDITTTKDIVDDIKTLIKADRVNRRIFLLKTYRVKKVTLKINGVDFMNIYNMAEFRLIPVIDQWAHPVVRLYYLFINYHICRSIGVNPKAVLSQIHKEHKKLNYNYAGFIGQTYEYDICTKLTTRNRYYNPKKYLRINGSLIKTEN